MKYAMDTKDAVKASGTVSISTKAAVKICREINRKDFDKARDFVNGLVEKKKSIDKKYYSKAAKEILNLLNIVESNAKAKDVDPNHMEVFISAHKGPNYMRSRRKVGFGLRMKMSHVQIVLKKRGK